MDESITINLNENIKVNLLKNDMEKSLGDNFKEKLESVDVTTQEFRDEISKTLVDDKIDRILISIEYKRADRL